MKKEWDILYKTALKQLKNIEIPPFIKVGESVCCILTVNNNAYVGKNINSNTTLNSCAEKNAIIGMLNNGEQEIKKIVILNELEEIIMPCTSCIEILLELTQKNNSIEILKDIKEYKTIKLEELLPTWWGTYKQKKDK